MSQNVKSNRKPQKSAPLVGRKRRSLCVGVNKTKKLKNNEVDDDSQDEVKISLPVKRKRVTKTKVNSNGTPHSNILTSELNPEECNVEDKIQVPVKTRNVGKLGVKVSTDVKNHSCPWKDDEYLADSEEISVSTARNVIKLLKEENTIPFIARYRNYLTGGLTPDKLRKIKATYENIQQVHIKAEQLIQQVKIKDVLTPEVLNCIQSAQTLEELDFIGSQFKKGSKKSLAERAKTLGLDVPAELILEGKSISIENYVNPKVSGLENIQKVKLGIRHIIAWHISKNPEVLSFVEKIYSSGEILIESKFKQNKNVGSASKYNLYGNFSQSIRAIKPHQTLAINRGESENELSVKIVIPDSLWMPLKTFCINKWLKPGNDRRLTENLLNDSLEDSIKRLLSPLAVRRIKSKLNQAAENEALLVFAKNLRQLLMTPPIAGCVVMGIDPGFRNGCKVAVVSQTGNHLDHDKFFLDRKVEAQLILKNLVLKHQCSIVALGNGKGCREAETLLSDLIQRRLFKPLNVSYTIVSEQGVSIYSCSTMASEEFPTLDPTFISAVSIARRLQNPLSELVKVEPKHLGVGMYQHDVKEKKLISLLDDIVSECVSFVGVDINSASLYLLRRVAGLNNSRAQEIIKYRSDNCTFKSREDIVKVKGIKTKTFQQCAGFIRVIPSTARCGRHATCTVDFNPLDETPIHPESYEITGKIIKRLGVTLSQLGNAEFVTTVKNAMKKVTVERLSNDYGCSPSCLSFIIDTLTQPKNFDLRTLSAGPIFRQGVQKLEELSPGQVLEGVVRNIVTFGAFVDIGVGSNGLIHSSQMGKYSLQLNDRVKIEVLSLHKVKLKMPEYLEQKSQGKEIN